MLHSLFVIVLACALCLMIRCFQNSCSCALFHYVSCTILWLNPHLLSSLQVQIRHPIRTGNQIWSIQNSPSWAWIRYSWFLPPCCHLRFPLCHYAIPVCYKYWIYHYLGIALRYGSMEGCRAGCCVWDISGIHWIECSGEFLHHSTFSLVSYHLIDSDI